MMHQLGVLAVVVVATLFATPASSDAAPAPTQCRGERCWRPSIGDTFALQLQGAVRVHAGVDVFDVDAVDTSARSVAALHQRGRRVVCYISAGTWERWRPDASSYPAAIIGEDLEDWPGERWLDVRDQRLRPILLRRIAACARKGFDAVEFDNVAGYQQQTGFALRFGDQVRFNRWLADAAHRAGLSVGLKNDPDQVRALVRWFDFAVVEQCFQYDECSKFTPFTGARKPVFVAEYALPLARFCREARIRSFSAARYPLALDGRRWGC